MLFKSFLLIHVSSIIPDTNGRNIIDLQEPYGKKYINLKVTENNEAVPSIENDGKFLCIVGNRFLCNRSCSSNCFTCVFI